MYEDFKTQALEWLKQMIIIPEEEGTYKCDINWYTIEVWWYEEEPGMRQGWAQINYGWYEDLVFFIWEYKLYEAVGLLISKLEK